MASLKLVKVEEVSMFAQRCMCRIGTNPEHAKQLAELLVAADSRGHYSHGLNRLGMYVRDVKAGTTLPDGQATVEKETVSTALVNGNNLLGPVASNFCMDLAMKKAKDTGVGWVTCHGLDPKVMHRIRSGEHFVLSLAEFQKLEPFWYCWLLQHEGCKTWFNWNGYDQHIATDGSNPGKNATGQNSDSDMFVLDMATTAAALGKVEMCNRKKENIPDGWAVDANGLATTDGQEAMKGGLMPLGGSETTSGYKGYGLGFMVELFCGILSGSTFGPGVRNWNISDTVADLGQCFVALDPSVFAPGFENRLSSLMNHCRGLDPAAGETEVLVAGDPERKHISEVEKDGGIRYHVNLLTTLDTMADELQVDHLKRL